MIEERKELQKKERKKRIVDENGRE